MLNLEYKDIKLIPKKSILKSREDADISARLGKFTFAAPVVAANMKSILTPQICKTFDERNWFYVQERVSGVDFVHRFAQYAQDMFNVVSLSIGISDDWLSLLSFFKRENYRIDFLTIDIAHAHTDHVIEPISIVKDLYPDTFLIVGNVSTLDAVEFLESLNVDCVKVGQGVSSACRTSQFTAFGSTSLGSLIECTKVNKSAQLMSDGGLTITGDDVWIGDIAKAIWAGADFVMSGSLFSRCIDCPAVTHGYAGNASAQVKGNRKHIEGASVKVSTNHLTISDMMTLVEDSLRSSVSYAGGTDLSSLSYVDYINLKYDKPVLRFIPDNEYII